MVGVASTMDEHHKHNASVSILCPRVAFHWQESADWPGGSDLTQAVLLHNQIYIGAKVRTHGRYFTSKLYSCTTDFDSWTLLPEIPCDVTGFALCAYQSRLVLAGGLRVTNQVVGDTWVSDDGHSWKQSALLPRLPTACHSAALLNTGTPEYLILAGGYADNFVPLNTVAVLVELQWFSLPTLPSPSYSTKFAFHNGYLYLVGSDSLLVSCDCYHCEKRTLIDVCNHVKSNNSKGLEGCNSLWKRLHMPEQMFCPVSFGRQLVARSRVVHEITELYAYSSSAKAWVHVGDVPKGLKAVSTYVIPTGELVVVCKGSGGRNKVLKAALRETTCNPDSKFSVCALSKLEAIGIQVMTSLAEIPQQFTVALNLPESMDEDYVMFTKLSDFLKFVIRFWLSEKGRYPPTWRSLHEVLRKLDLTELSQQMEEYLTSVFSLKELCTAVITSAFLESGLLELQQILAGLPNYVPPSVKLYLAHQVLS